jgi:DNA-binding CsgD family transcriptional regulator
MSPETALPSAQEDDLPSPSGPTALATARSPEDAGTGVENLTAYETIVDLVAELVATATTSLWGAHPGAGFGPDHVETWWGPLSDMAARGVEVRTLLQHSTRTQTATQSYAALALPAGVLIRTVPVIAARTLIFDGTTALASRIVDGRSDGALLIRDPGLVGYLARGYEASWALAQDFPALLDAQGQAVEVDQTARTVLALLADGHKDEVVARRLGCSVRTARRHVSSLMELLDSSSRFQAGARAAQAGLLD